jgi:uncharacterized protein (TIGR02284 family)
MATLRGNEDSILHLVANLIELDFDAIEAYSAAIERLDDPTSRETMSTFRRDHEEHVEDLSAVMESLGGAPPHQGDFKRILTRGKVVLAALAGDKAVLAAMKTNEDDTNAAYERAAQRTEIPAQLASVLQKNLADERRHRTWIEQRIKQLAAMRQSASVTSGPSGLNR